MAPLYELGQDDLIALPGRSFSEFAITERGDLQRLLRDHIAAISFSMVSSL